jgi:VanZ family protein
MDCPDGYQEYSGRSVKIIEQVELLTLVYGRVATLLILLLVTYLSVTPQSFPVIDDLNDKMNHVAAFAVLTYGFSRYWSLSLVTVFVGMMCYGVGIEFVQSYIPGRVPSAADIVADIVGVIVGSGFVNRKFQ